MIPPLFQTRGPLTDLLELKTGRLGLAACPDSKNPDQLVTSVCGFCSTGCGLTVHLKDGVPVNLTPDADYPVNLGMACPKGWEALRVLDSDDRATVPLIRDRDTGKQRQATWTEAINYFCKNFKEVQERYGAESVAFLSTGQIPTEEMAFLGCLAKFGMGMLHGDGNTRQCMATSVVAYKESFGFDAPPFTYEDFEQSDALVFIGANPCVAHPIMWQRVLRNQKNPSIIVIDPRATETAMAATEHLALQPKSDLSLLYGLANHLIQLDAIDKCFIESCTSNFPAFREFLSSFSMERVSEETGIPIEQFHRVASIISQSKRCSFWWTMGVNQSYQGVRTAQAIINLALMTGNIGKPGTGANSITGQCNAMGSRLFSNTTNLIGHHDFNNLSDRVRVAEILSIPFDRIPSSGSLAYDQILSGIESGKIKGLWIVATNTAHSWINSQRARELLSKLDFLVVQDMYSSTETVAHADLLLPAAGWGEKEGTFINSERRIGVIRRVSKAPGQALADFSIFRLIANAWGCSELFEKWQKPEDVFQILKNLSKDRPHDFTGIQDYRMLDRCGGIQWPFPSSVSDPNPVPKRERRLFEDGRFYHPDGRARFIFETPRGMSEGTNQQFPFLLMTGRGSVSKWHTQTRTSKSPLLKALAPTGAYVEINPNDAIRLGIIDGDSVCVESVRASITVKAVISASIKPCQLFISMHEETTNFLTHEQVDPYSRQPSYKDCAVRISLFKPNSTKEASR